MAAAHTNRIPIYGWLLPLVALVGGLLVGKSGDWITGVALAVLLIGSVMVAVHHAEMVALWLGEPYGTLVLTLAVTIIELALIISLMLTGKPNPNLARDTIHAVVMLVLNGLAGICIVAGTLRHREQEFRTLGANAFLAVLTPMSILVLVLPNYTLATPGPYYSKLQLLFVGGTCFALYLVFLFVQTVRHQDYFVPSNTTEVEHITTPPARIGAISGGLLVLYSGRGGPARQTARAVHREWDRRSRSTVQARGRNRRGDRAVAGVLRCPACGAAQSTADQYQSRPRQCGGLHRPHRPRGNGDRHKAGPAPRPRHR